MLTIGTGGAIVSGRVVWEGKPSLERDELLINVSPTEAMFLWGGQARVDANQQFTLKDLRRGISAATLRHLEKLLQVDSYGQTFVKDDDQRFKRPESSAGDHD
jgi:hypothetical protein